MINSAGLSVFLMVSYHIPGGCVTPTKDQTVVQQHILLHLCSSGRLDEFPVVLGWKIL